MTEGRHLQRNAADQPLMILGALGSFAEFYF